MKVLAYRVSKGKGSKHLNPHDYLREIAKETRTRVVPEVTDQLDLWQKDWEHQTDWSVRVQARGDQIVTYINAKGPNKMYWLWTSRGTKRHDIPVGEKGFLAFPWDGVRGNYNPNPKTLPQGESYGSGPVEWVYTQKPIDHPGTKARLFEERTMKRYRPKYRRHVRRATTKVMEKKRKEWQRLERKK